MWKLTDRARKIQSGFCCLPHRLIVSDHEGSIVKSYRSTAPPTSICLIHFWTPVTVATPCGSEFHKFSVHWVNTTGFFFLSVLNLLPIHFKGSLGSQSTGTENSELSNIPLLLNSHLAKYLKVWHKRIPPLEEEKFRREEFQKSARCKMRGGTGRYCITPAPPPHTHNPAGMQRLALVIRFSGKVSKVTAGIH